MDFDNSAFLDELEARGFHIASEATSNYVSTPHSLASSLNMSYLHELGSRTPANHSDLINLVYYNALAAILKSLGYTYVHLESGHQFTSKAPLADILSASVHPVFASFQTKMIYRPPSTRLFPAFSFVSSSALRPYVRLLRVSSYLTMIQHTIGGRRIVPWICSSFCPIKSELPVQSSCLPISQSRKLRRRSIVTETMSWERWWSMNLAMIMIQVFLMHTLDSSFISTHWCCD